MLTENACSGHLTRKKGNSEVPELEDPWQLTLAFTCFRSMYGLVVSAKSPGSWNLLRWICYDLGDCGTCSKFCCPTVELCERYDVGSTQTGLLCELRFDKLLSCTLFIKEWLLVGCMVCVS